MTSDLPVLPAALAPGLIRVPPQGMRRAATTLDQDAAMLASVRAIGVLQPIVVRPAADGEAYELVIGRRRLRAALEAGLQSIPAICRAQLSDTDAAAMEAAENLCRAAMAPVDQWRAILRLQELGWTLDTAALALGLSDRLARRLDRLGRLHPDILAAIEEDGLPEERLLREIAGAPPARQADAWKRLGKARDWGGTRYDWHGIANACRVTRYPKARARFGDDLAAEFGVTWEEDLFAEPGSDGVWTTADTVAFERAQQAWVERVRMPELAGRKISARWIGTGKAGEVPKLPKGAEREHGDEEKAPKNRIRGYSLGYGGELLCTLFKPPEPKKEEPAKGKAGAAAAKGKAAPAADEDEAPRPAEPSEPARPPISKAGLTEIAVRQTERIREDLRERAKLCTDMPDARTLLACMILLLDADNVTVHNGDGDFEDLAARLLEPNGALAGEVVRSVELERLALLALARSLRAVGPDAGSYNRGSGAALGRIACAIGVTFPRCDDAEFLQEHVTKAELLRAGQAARLPLLLPNQKLAEIVKGCAGALHDAGWHPARWDRAPPNEHHGEDEDLAELEPWAVVQARQASAAAAAPPAPAEPQAKPAAAPKVKKAKPTKASIEDTAECGWDGEHECPRDTKEHGFACDKCPRGDEYAKWWDSSGAAA